MLVVAKTPIASEHNGRDYVIDTRTPREVPDELARRLIAAGLALEVVADVGPAEGTPAELVVRAPRPRRRTRGVPPTPPEVKDAAD